MNIIVCIKQVPGSNQVEADPVTGVLKRDGVASKLNPYDLYAIETSLRLAEETGCKVHAVSMGPMQAMQAVKEAVLMGADSGTLVSDRRFGGADVLATAYTLSQAIAKAESPGLVICGKQTTDGDTAQVGAEIAEFLGWPHANNVQKIEPDGEKFVKVRINMDSCISKQRMPLPCVLCVDGDINTPRLPSFKRKLAFNEKCINTLSLEDFEDKNPEHYGLSGSPTQVEKIFPPEKNSEKLMFSGSAAEMANALARTLAEKKLI